MKRNQQGFTMIELIVVIVILGILAATALPKFIDMRSEAQTASLQGVAGAANSAMNLNYSACALTNHSTATGKCAAVSACTDVAGLLQNGLPTGYVAGGTDPAATNGSISNACTITADGTSVTFTAITAGQ